MKEQILEMLYEADGYVSGQAASLRLGISRQAVSKAVASLREQGFEIDSVPNRGYLLRGEPSFLNEQALAHMLRGSAFGRSITVLDGVESTNDYLKRLAVQGAESGAVVAAREQTRGKGRLGRVWQSKKDEGIAVSLLLRPSIAPYEVSAITPLAGLAVCEALRELSGEDCLVKWPNDVIAGGKKLSGILTEMSAELNAVEYIVIGIGINVSQTAFPGDIEGKATSLKLAAHREFNNNEVLACVLRHLESAFSGNDLRLSADSLSRYSRLCATLGREVSFIRNGKTLSGTANAIGADGELKVTLSDGSVCSVTSGEVTVQGIY